MISSAPKKVLIVDDEPFILAATARLLEAQGHQVATCDEWTKVAGAVRSLEPDVVLMDYNMPSIKGDELCAILKRNNGGSAMRIIIFSSESESDLVGIVARCGADGFIKKDVGTQALMERLDMVLGATAA